MTQKIQQLEVTLDGEIKERETLAKQLRKAEKALTEASSQLTETEESEQTLKAQVKFISQLSFEINQFNIANKTSCYKFEAEYNVPSQC